MIIHLIIQDIIVCIVEETVLKEITGGGSRLRRLTTLTMCALCAVTTLACPTATIETRMEFVH